MNKTNTFYPLLKTETRQYIDSLLERYHFTFQEFRTLSEAARDLEMWGQENLTELWEGFEKNNLGFSDSRVRKDKTLSAFQSEMAKRKSAPKVYGSPDTIKKPSRETLRPAVSDTSKKIHGDCPVASPETVCCNLKTIDAVENCAFGCSYCTIQTFYGSEAVFDSRFKEKLDSIEIDPNRFYHFGTGQSSDSLVWGNKEGILDALCGFARKHPNMLLEFKTKSDNVRYFLENEIPRNVVCSWSLNTQAVIENEEHFTANLEKRLAAARKAADRGIAVAFHFHPIVYYQGWEDDYPVLAQRVLGLFNPNEVLFISFSSVTFIKPVMQEIRKRGDTGKILQMELVPTAKGKLSYPAELKIRQFKLMHETFTPWQDKVFRYLCMEPANIWDAVWGWHYPTNEAFEKDFGAKIMSKLAAQKIQKS